MGDDIFARAVLKGHHLAVLFAVCYVSQFVGFTPIVYVRTIHSVSILETKLIHTGNRNEKENP